MQGHKYWHFCNFLILYFEKNLGFLPSKLECKSSSVEFFLVFMDIECMSSENEISKLNISFLITNDQGIMEEKKAFFLIAFLLKKAISF